MGLKHLTVVCEMARVQVPSLAAREGKTLLLGFSNQFFVLHLPKLRKQLVLNGVALSISMVSAPPCLSSSMRETENKKKFHVHFC